MSSRAKPVKKLAKGYLKTKMKIKEPNNQRRRGLKMEVGEEKEGEEEEEKKEMEGKRRPLKQREGWWWWY